MPYLKASVTKLLGNATEKLINDKRFENQCFKNPVSIKNTKDRMGNCSSCFILRDIEDVKR